MKTMIILFVLAWQGAAGLLFAQKLTLEVRGFEAIKGRLNVAFYHSQETFMKEALNARRPAAAVYKKDKGTLFGRLRRLFGRKYQ